jgi:hypothetical protein
MRDSKFLGKVLLARPSTLNLDDHPLSTVFCCFFDIFAATLHIGGCSSICNPRTRHAVVTANHWRRRNQKTEKPSELLWEPQIQQALNISFVVPTDCQRNIKLILFVLCLKEILKKVTLPEALLLSMHMETCYCNRNRERR